MSREKSISKGVDWLVIFLYAILVCTGMLCIFMVEYKTGSNWVNSFLTGQTDYSKQLYFTGICIVAAAFIMLSDSKLYTAFANILYLLGIGLMLLTFVIGKAVNGSKSWIPLGGGFNLQPAELCIIFSALALAKYLSRQDTDFTKPQSQAIAAGLAMFPAMLSILQNETGLAIVYSCFFIVMFREGLPSWILIVGFSFGVLVVATLVMEPNILAVILTLIAAGSIYFMRKTIKRNRNLLVYKR